MATTPNYGWTYPTVGANADTWGTILNTMAIAIDASLKTVDDGLAARLLASNNLSDLANAATARTNLGLGTAATHPSTDFASSATAAPLASPTFTGTVTFPDGSTASSSGIVGAGPVSDGIGNVRTIPGNAQSGYTLVVGDNGKFIDSAGNVTVPSGVFSKGMNVLIYNNTTGNISVVSSGVTVYLAGVGTTGTRTLAQKGFATLLCVGSNTFSIGGTGLT